MPSGIIIVDKPVGITSHGVVSRLRKVLGTKKIGHAGTLDPMATGVLILGVNRATRLLGQLALKDKSYEATIRFGASTTTDDAEGELVAVSTAAHLDEGTISQALRAYVGVIQQVPSSVSAIKVGGKRAYALVRAGEQVELKPREVEISRLELLRISHQDDFVDADIRMDCSTGTYVRALARDLGRDLGVGAHLTALRRTRIGNYGLELAIALPEPGDEPVMMTMGAAARLSFPVIEVDDASATEVKYGRPLALEVPADPTAVLHNNELLALYQPVGPGNSKPLAVFC